MTPEARKEAIDAIALAPGALRAALAGLTAEQLDTPYRAGGWTVQQVAHHVADSHLNAFVRFKIALTEDVPEIRPYDEGAWADTPDVLAVPVEASLAILDGLHARWTSLLRSMERDEFKRLFRHPEHDGTPDLDWLLQLYAWHGAHHVAHVVSLRDRMGW
jgi:uncharacterized damage-inducible protein DinB